MTPVELLAGVLPQMSMADKLGWCAFLFFYSGMVWIIWNVDD